ncbi:SUMF1/EgtB/PvdO family nonheme iron enzyme [Candidatus Kaiserbacteria bacterium]|nr:SUMF1/EgtB/PvdO family nonheme iron enzyme [Candidatus Kaiserbacteria bacterium]MCB9811907.1 SUMF1/EgtB/PvdO family nonheme iron enzyme [Candidatus Nomurabacteria bacterium]
MKAVKYLLICGVAVLITALGIDAADTLQGSSGTMLAQLLGSNEQAGCPTGMLEIPTAGTFTCVDQYEASPAPDCPESDTSELGSSQSNVADASCKAVAHAGVLPWRNLTREEAVLVCARSGKRLPTAAEWYQFALGSPDIASVCNIDSGSLRKAGTAADCRSTYDVYDVVGNVWEWVSDDVFDGTYQGRSLPPEGYVVQVDSGGIATAVGTEDDQYGADYFWSKPEGAYAMMRGGYYGSRDDAGVFAVHAATDPNFIGDAIGFRCVQ